MNGENSGFEGLTGLIGLGGLKGLSGLRGWDPKVWSCLGPGIPRCVFLVLVFLVCLVCLDHRKAQNIV